MSETLTIHPPAYRRLSGRLVAVIVWVLFAIAAIAAVLLFAAAADHDGVRTSPSVFAPDNCGTRTRVPTPC